MQWQSGGRKRRQTGWRSEQMRGHIELVILRSAIKQRQQELIVSPLVQILLLIEITVFRLEVRRRNVKLLMLQHQLKQQMQLIKAM